MSQACPIVFALFPRITQLDFTGPHEMLSRLPGAQCILASEAGGVIEADGGLSFETVRLSSVKACTLLCVPGGYGVVGAMSDAAFLAELRRLAAVSRYVTSVCTGSLLLGAAGLLQGKRAACHWAWRELLAPFGALPDEARVVRDGHTITGGGVTAGIDMALTVIAEIAGPEYAQAVQLATEYAPAPPFDAGRPETAAPAVLTAVRARMERMGSEREASVQRAAAALRA